MRDFIYDYHTAQKLHDLWRTDRDSVEFYKHGKKLERVVNVNCEVDGDFNHRFSAIIEATHWLTGEGLAFEVIPNVEVRRRQSDTDMYEWFLNRKPGLPKRAAQISRVQNYIEFCYPVQPVSRRSPLCASINYDSAHLAGFYFLQSYEQRGDFLIIHVQSVDRADTLRREYHILDPAFDFNHRARGTELAFSVFAGCGGGGAWWGLAQDYFKSLSNQIGLDIPVVSS
jgi:hypothetical protein